SAHWPVNSVTDRDIEPSLKTVTPWFCLDPHHASWRALDETAAPIRSNILGFLEPPIAGPIGLKEHMSQVAERRRSQAARTVVLSAEVVARKQVSPSFARVTLGGEGLAHLEAVGYDQWFRLFLPREHEGGLPLPAAPVDTDWYGRFRSAAAEDRPVMRYGTGRDYRSLPSGTSGGGYAELDVDVVIHGHPD